MATMRLRFLGLSSRWQILVGLGVVTVPTLALLQVWYPMSGDQALFVLGATEIARGGRYYVDFWDNKQPGVYWFHVGAIAALGPTLVAVRLAEMVWHSITGAFLAAAAWEGTNSPLAAASAPVLAFAVLYGLPGIAPFGQVESLVGLPLSALLWLLVKDVGRSSEIPIAVFRLLGAGACVAITVAFKFVLVLVPAAMIAVWFTNRWRAHGVSSALRTVGLLVAGALLALAILCMPFLVAGTLREAFYATFVYPRAIIGEVEGPGIGRLKDSLIWFLKGAWPVVVLSGLGFVDRKRIYPASGALLAICLAWVMSGSVALVFQRLSWWDYHFAMFVFPLGVLGGCGVSALLEWSARSKWTPAKFALATGLAAILAFPVAVKAYHVIQAGLKMSWDHQRMVEYLVPGHAEMRQATLRFMDCISPKSLMVYGNPNIQLFSKLPPALSISGWTFYTHTQIDAIADAFDRNPPEAIYMTQRARFLLSQGSQAVASRLAQRYTPRPDPVLQGDWLVLNEKAMRGCR